MSENYSPSCALSTRVILPSVVYNSELTRAAIIDMALDVRQKVMVQGIVEARPPKSFSGKAGMLIDVLHMCYVFFLGRLKDLCEGSCERGNR